MKKTINFFKSISILLIITGCVDLNNSVVIPMEGNKYSVVSSADSDSNSIRAAMYKATGVCGEQNKNLVVLSNHTTYQGAGKELGAITKIAHDVAFFNSGLVIPSSKSDEDYKTTVIFRCD